MGGWGWGGGVGGGGGGRAPAPVRGGGVDWGYEGKEKRGGEAGGPVSCCCSGSVGQRHAARTHMENRLNSSADSNCPSVVSLGKHVSRQRRLAARAR